MVFLGVGALTLGSSAHLHEEGPCLAWLLTGARVPAQAADGAFSHRRMDALTPQTVSSCLLPGSSACTHPRTG